MKSKTTCQTILNSLSDRNFGLGGGGTMKKERLSTPFATKPPQQAAKG
jgi:hypothetical protein